MRYQLVAFLLLLLITEVCAQTLQAPSEACNEGSPVCGNDSRHDAVTEQGSASPKQTPELPDAPSARLVAKPEVWDLAEKTAPAVPPRLDPIWDKKMWAAHLALAGSMIFDVEMTHQGLAHHQCVEGNDNLSLRPSRSELYIDNLKQFGPIVFMDWLGTAAVRNGHLPRWIWKPMGLAGPIYSSIVHIKGGLAWYTRCW